MAKFRGLRPLKGQVELLPEKAGHGSHFSGFSQPKAAKILGQKFLDECRFSRFPRPNSAARFLILLPEKASVVAKLRKIYKFEYFSSFDEINL